MGDPLILDRSREEESARSAESPSLSSKRSGPVGLATPLWTAGREQLDLNCSIPSKVSASTLFGGNSRWTSAKQLFSVRGVK